jgi:hypothetical protein
MNTKNLLAIDLETGGLNPAIHPILSISAVPGWISSWAGNVFHQLVLPEPSAPIEMDAILVNGYDRDAWKHLGAVPINEALDRFRMWLLGRPADVLSAVPLAHNAGFDAAFLRMHGPIPALSSRWECSRSALLTAQRAGLVRKGGSSLDHLAALAGLPARGSVHYGPEDAQLCLQGYQWLLRRFRPSLFSRILSSILPVR